MIHVQITSEVEEEIEGNVKWTHNLHFEDSMVTFLSHSQTDHESPYTTSTVVFLKGDVAHTRDKDIRSEAAICRFSSTTI